MNRMPRAFLGQQRARIAGGISRRGLMGGLAAASAGTLAGQPAAGQERRPNVLFIMIDDQNDWVGHLHGHPLAYTPNIDALADRGTCFTNAHVQSPLCNPCRVSLLTGLRPSTTGVYGLAPQHRDVEMLRDHVTMPEFFTNTGYTTSTHGKIYHSVSPEYRSREFNFWPDEPPSDRPPQRLAGGDTGGTLVDWGMYPERDEDARDYKIADQAIEQLRNMPADDPFLLAVGFHLPHVPCYAPPKWFERLPEEQVILPPINGDDRDDTPAFSWYLHWRLPEPRLSWYEKYGELENFVRSYLACTSFVDAQVGRVLSALEESGRADDTIVVLVGDHGYHLGEKEITGKNTLWERSTRVPFVWAGPGIPRRVVNDPAELLDIYPTLVELAGFPARQDIEGRSLVPQFRGERRTIPAITTHNVGNHGIRTDRWRYIRYADGSEELYNMFWDPNEWTNLAPDSKYQSVKEELAQWLPKVNTPPVPPADQARVLAPTEDGGWMWQGERIVPGEVPQEPQPVGGGRPAPPPNP